MDTHGVRIVPALLGLRGQLRIHLAGEELLNTLDVPLAVQHLVDPVLLAHGAVLCDLIAEVFDLLGVGCLGQQYHFLLSEGYSIQL